MPSIPYKCSETLRLCRKEVDDVGLREMFRKRKVKGEKALDVNAKEDMEENGGWHLWRATRLCLPAACNHRTLDAMLVVGGRLNLGSPQAYR